MGRRRVFKTRVEYSGHSSRDKLPAKGQPVALRTDPSEGGIEVVWNGGVVLGHLDSEIAQQITSAMALGQSFKGVIENAYELAGGIVAIHLKVEYFLDHGNPAIEVRKQVLSDADTGEWKTFYTNVAGVTHMNSDGSERQRILSRCRVGEWVTLVREPNNQHDPYAVKVLNESGLQIGYLPMDITGNGRGIGWCVGENMDRGVEYIARISDITGETQQHYGMNLQLSFWKGSPGSRPPDSFIPALQSDRSGETRNGLASSGTGCLTLIVITLLLIIFLPTL